MSSPEDAIKLASDLKQRQADRRFPTLAKRDSSRKQRPTTQLSLHSGLGSHSSGYGSTNEKATEAGSSSPIPAKEVDSSEQAGESAAQETSPAPKDPITLPDDDDEEAGVLEMDYALPNEQAPVESTNTAAPHDDDGHADPSATTENPASSSTLSPKRKTKKKRPGSLRRSTSTSSAGITGSTSADSLSRPAARRAEPSQHEMSEGQRMSVLVEGEMPEGSSVEDEDIRARRRSQHSSTASIDDAPAEDGLENAAAESDIEEDDDEEEGSEGDDEEDPEPSLKYSRVKGGATDVLKKDTASAFAVSSRFMALGTHGGMIYILDVDGNLVKGFRLHTASILDLVIDSASDFVAAASMDGLVTISALATSEQYIFDFKRPMRCVSLEPNFGRKSTRSFVCGGMAGAVSQREKSWFGHKETILHSGEGPIWTTQWRGNLIAWANDTGVRIYDNTTHQRISFISAPSEDARADLYRCTLYWQDDRTLLVAWADHIKVAKIRDRNQPTSPPASIRSSSLSKPGSAVVGTSRQPHYVVEITAIFQLDCMISGIVPYGLDYLVLAYITEEPSESDSEEVYKRREALRPELRIISRAGEELSSDVLSLNDFARFQCNDYLLVPSAEARAYSAALLAGRKVRTGSTAELSQFYVVSPKDIVVSKPRDDKDHVEWLLERRRYQEALVKVEAMGSKAAAENGFNAEEIGRNYLNFLVDEGRFDEAARVASKILGRNVGAWEDWIFMFVEKGQLGTAIPYVPTSDPTLTGLIYDMILAHFLQHDPTKLLSTVEEWPAEIYSTQAVVLAIEDRLAGKGGKDKATARLLMECLAEIYIRNRQPSKALVWFLRLRRPNVFDLIRENNLFTAVQDQALLLVEFEEDLKTRRHQQSVETEKTTDEAFAGTQTSKHGAAIDLLVDHTFSISINRVIQQLDGHPRYLYMYLDALFERDSNQVTPYSDLQVNLYAEFEPERLMAYLRAMSSFYSFEKAYKVCSDHDYIPEMVFLLGRVGDNKRALSLIIERLGDVERAIDFAKEQNDDDLWEDLLKYSESRPAFIRGLLENVGPEIDPIRLIRRIKNGLEVPGLKQALIKILSDFALQISLLEGCEAILSHDTRVLADELQRSQRYATYADRETVCSTCGQVLFSTLTAFSGNNEADGAGKMVTDTFSAARQPKVVVYLCGHMHHLTCLLPTANIPAPKPADLATREILLRGTTSQGFASSRSVRNRWGSVDYKADHSITAAADTDGELGAAGFGPKLRADELTRLLQAKLKYEARLRTTAVSKKGCPSCTKQGLSPTSAVF